MRTVKTTKNLCNAKQQFIRLKKHIGSTPIVSVEDMP
nr:MAG TPA: hypothetical protein [Caudoviricetes sp.]